MRGQLSDITLLANHLNRSTMKQVFIMIVGFSRSGKTTLANKIIARFPSLTKIDADLIHDFLNSTYPVFKDDNTVDGTAYKMRRKTTKKIQGALASSLLEAGHSVLLDSCNVKKDIRDKIFSIVKELNRDITTIIVRHKIDEKTLYKNIRKADQEKGGTIWKDLYEKVQKPEFNEPTKNEADRLLIHEDNTDEIIAKIENLING